MASLDALVERLPSLYRPEPDDGTLLVSLLGAVAAQLDAARDDASLVLPAHWVLHADRADFDPWFSRRRERSTLPALVTTDLVDFADARAYLRAVKDALTPLTLHLRASADPRFRAALDAWDGLVPPPALLQRRALDALTRLARGALLYTPARFAGVVLTPETVARAEANPPGAERTAVNVQLLLEAFPDALRTASLDLPWVRDLARLGALVPLVPWREPPALRETVESFRLRLARMVALYRNGLGTVGALRTVVEATLPVDIEAPAERRDRPFSIEEFAPLALSVEAAPTNGPPDGLVGPLMRWAVTSAGLTPAAPTLYITGLAAGEGIAATERPMIERFAGTGATPRVAIGYTGTVPADQTLRLRPSLATWTAGEAGLVRTEHLPEPSAADVATDAVEAAVPGAPADIVALLRTVDGALWAGAAGGTTLARFDGVVWADHATGLAAIRCLAEHAGVLLLGTASGLLRVPLLPAPGDDDAPATVAGFEGVAVRTIARGHAGGFWIGTDTGALRWDGTAAPEAVPLGGEADVATAVHAIHVDPGGAIHFATDLGAFEFQPVRDVWHWYAGGAFTEQSPEWRAFGPAPDGVPGDARVFLPPVRDLVRGPDGSLWFATAAGIARYVARAVDGGTTYTTLLEAFPDLGEGPATCAHVAERGDVWFCTTRGLLRFDGRDWWQRRAGTWTHLGRADLIGGPVARARGGWRFDRASARWQRFDENGAGWIVPEITLATTDEPDVGVLLITDHVVAHLGTGVGEEFAAAGPVDAADLFLRIKPADDRIADGGMPYIPRIPSGTSTWRYLMREAGDLVEPEPAVRPAWSTEGRLFPPPPALDAPYAGRYDIAAPPDGGFDQAVFAYDPAARVTFAFAPRTPCSVLVRLRRRAADPPYDPAILDRVWEGIQLVRPAGVRALLAVDGTTVRS
jgi:hypothetical protein